MLKLFYQTVLNFYKKRWPQHDPWFYAWMATALMVSFNCLSIYFAVEYCLKFACNPLMAWAAGFVSAFLFLYFYLAKINEDAKFILFRTIYKYPNYAAILYIIATLVIMISIANMHRSLLPNL